MRHLKALALMLVLSAIAIPAALAGNAHFIGTPQLTQTTDAITVTFKAAGLGNVDVATFSLTGTVDVSSRCYTKKGNTPQAANKQESISVNDSEPFPVSNGQTTGSFTISPVSTLTCPGGQHVVIESLTYDLFLSGQGITPYEFKS
jgi:hypothetical protein